VEQINCKRQGRGEAEPWALTQVEGSASKELPCNAEVLNAKHLFAVCWADLYQPGSRCPGVEQMSKGAIVAVRFMEREENSFFLPSSHLQENW